MLPFFGIKPAVFNPLQKEGNEPLVGGSGVLCLSQPWPGMARTILGDHSRYMATYFEPYPGFFFTGDGCAYDNSNHLWITGRVDDVINKAGHRLGTAEIENALSVSLYSLLINSNWFNLLLEEPFVCRSSHCRDS